MDAFNLQIVITLTVGFTLACLLGYFTQRIKLSPILGYLLAGYIIGPFSPGYVADLHLAEQLAEVGVMLMMFGVGLHFKWQDLVDVKNIAIPGALGQTFVATVLAALLVHLIGGSWEAGVIIGLAIGVASTVVLVRVLEDNHILRTLQGHIAVGWLIVEDILTVGVLILLPTIVAILTGVSVSFYEISSAVGIVLFKFILLIAFMFTLGRKFVSYALLKIARTNSPELFTLGVLSLTFLIATGSALVFGTSIALGAFIAGMIIGQTEVSHQASAYASPMKDAFVVIFFLSVGMLFNPMAIVDHFLFFLSILGIILIIKPLTAYLIVILMRYPRIVGLNIAFALAQIGEFSFILAEEAGKFDIFPDEGYDIIVACALVSIALNPLLFQLLDYLKPYLNQETDLMPQIIPDSIKEAPKAMLVGYGLIGRNIINTLEELGYRPLVIETDVDKVTKLRKQQRLAVYGDASFPHILETARMDLAPLLVITISDLSSILNIIHYARAIHPGVKILAYAQHTNAKELLTKMGVSVVCGEEKIVHGFERLIVKINEELLLST